LWLLVQFVAPLLDVTPSQSVLFVVFLQFMQRVNAEHVDEFVALLASDIPAKTFSGVFQVAITAAVGFAMSVQNDRT
jgi:hypothetical protein